jgi:tetratricopeptide (TPR) repeat protein
MFSSSSLAGPPGAGPNADVDAVSPELRRFLGRYTQAWSSLNPFELQRLAAPGQPVFRSLIRSDELDLLRSKTVSLEALRVSGNRQLTFVEVHDNLTRGGTLQSVRLQVELALVDAGGYLAIRKRLARPLEASPYARQLGHVLQAIDTQRYDQAITILEELLPEVSVGETAHPVLEAELKYYMALVHRGQGNATEARAALVEALALHPFFPWAQKALAEQEIIAGRLHEARRLLARARSLDPGQAEARSLLMLIDAALAVGSEAEATRFLIAWLMAEANGLGGDWHGELSGAKAGVAGLNLKALALLLANRLEPARAALVQARSLDDYSPLTRYLSAKVWLLLGRYAAAEEILDDLGDEAPPCEGCDDVLLLHGLALEGSDQNDEALELYEALRRSGSGAHEGIVHLRTGRLLLRLGRETEAGSALDQARRYRLNQQERNLLYDIIQEQGYDPLR